MKLLTFTNGAVTFCPKIPPTPATETTEGNVTVRNAETRGRPAHFTVSHFIGVAVEQNGVEQTDYFHLTSTVFHKHPIDALYAEVEDAAARQIPGKLRQLADLIEADLDKVESERQRRGEQHKD